jgi:hypothetical protein
MTPPDQTLIPEQVLWSVQSEKNAFRVDLLNQIPGLRSLLLSDWWPQRVWLLVMALFIPVTVTGFIGPQTRESSMALNFFWAWWWPGYLFFFAFVGRLWCSICPFMITGEWLRRLSLWLWPRQQRPWPTPGSTAGELGCCGRALWSFTCGSTCGICPTTRPCPPGC